MVLSLLVATFAQAALDDRLLVDRAADLMSSALSYRTVADLPLDKKVAKVIRRQDGVTTIVRVVFAEGTEVEFNPRTAEFVALMDYNGFPSGDPKALTADQALVLARRFFGRVAPAHAQLGPMSFKTEPSKGQVEVSAEIQCKGVPFEIPRLHARVSLSDGTIRRFSIGRVPGAPMGEIPVINRAAILNACAWHHFGHGGVGTVELGSKPKLVIMSLPPNLSQIVLQGGTGFFPLGTRAIAAKNDSRGYYGVLVTARNVELSSEWSKLWMLDARTGEPLRVMDLGANAGSVKPPAFNWEDWNGQVTILSRKESMPRSIVFREVRPRSFTMTPVTILIKKGARYLKLEVDETHNLVRTGKRGSYRYSTPDKPML